MILTHFLALLAAPSAGISPAAALLPISSSAPLLGNGRLEPALLPALPVRLAPALLVIRER